MPPWTAGARFLPIPPLGAIAQLGERLDRTQEVGGSSPPSSIAKPPLSGGFFFLARARRSGRSTVVYRVRVIGRGRRDVDGAYRRRAEPATRIRFTLASVV